MIDHLVMHLITKGIGALSKKGAELDPEGITCRTALLPRLLLPVGAFVFLAATNHILSDPKARQWALGPGFLAVGMMVACLHFWTLKIRATRSVIEFGSVVTKAKVIDLTRPFEFRFEPHQSILVLRQGRTKLVLDHYFDGRIGLLEWIVATRKSESVPDGASTHVPTHGVS